MYTYPIKYSKGLYQIKNYMFILLVFTDIRRTLELDSLFLLIMTEFDIRTIYILFINEFPTWGTIQTKNYRSYITLSPTPISYSCIA